jgi:DNA-binding GntR family transcriptional regulator
MTQPTIQFKKPGAYGRPKGSGSQLIYDELRNQILTLEMQPGALVDEPALVRTFKLSRTPVREALIRLEADGLVEIVPNRGARVASLNFDRVNQMFEAMDLFSRAICYLAAKRREPDAMAAARRANEDFATASRQNDFREMGEANWRFHNQLGRASGNLYLADAQTRIMTETMRLAYLTHHFAVKTNPDYKAYFKRIFTEHEQILANVEAGRADEAEALAGQHTKLFKENLSRFMMRDDLSAIRVVDAASASASRSAGSRRRARNGQQSG